MNKNNNIIDATSSTLNLSELDSPPVQEPNYEHAIEAWRNAESTVSWADIFQKNITYLPKDNYDNLIMINKEDFIIINKEDI